MKAPFSPYLTELAPGLKELIRLLEKDFDSVSVLSTDCVGFSVSISQHGKNISHENLTTERGTVVRVRRAGQYAEAALTGFDPSGAEETAAWVRGELNSQLEMLESVGVKAFDTPETPDDEASLFVEMETEQLPETADLPDLVRRFSDISDRGMKEGRDMLDCLVRGSSTHISKLFLTGKRDLRQSYVYSEGSVVTLASRDGKTESDYEAVSGRKGPEIFTELEGKLDTALRVVEELLGAERVVPGEYECITAPDVTGLIAHEAFGHGVEMDMFVKGRALGAEYIGKRVGSDLVTMHEGALCAEDVTSYAFDDEGVMAGDVTEIDRGILKTGICDTLSALRLGTSPTGNGKRESFSHKVYTRMTNTIFDSGNSTLDEMIASIKKGYLLEGMDSGMEDPKHWGIQCLLERGYEIIDGKLTGKVVSPVVMTGYVPDLLGSVSMLSGDREVFGSGYCGKGHKEWVKVADGGPYLKVKARLG